MPYTCIIVDDEPLARQVLFDLIQNIDQIEVIGKCADAIEAANLIRKSPPDILFLDINMPKLSGLELKRSLQDHIVTIFTTAYPDYAVEAFEVEAFDYIVKPISFDRLFKSCQRAISFLESKDDRDNKHTIVIKENKRLYRIDTDNISHIQAYGDYVRIYTPNKTYISKDRLSNLESALSSDFIKVHRSYIVNTQHINYIEGNFVMIAKHQIPISATGKTILMDRL